MKPSRIVKSAYRSAVKAGFKGSLKAYARDSRDNAKPDSDTCARWLDNKAKQRKPSASRGHYDVHAAAVARSTRHANGGR